MNQIFADWYDELTGLFKTAGLNFRDCFSLADLSNGNQEKRVRPLYDEGLIPLQAFERLLNSGKH